MIFTKKQLKLLIQENLSFVYEFICSTYGYDKDFETWLNDYDKWLKQFTSKKNEKEK